MADSTPLFSAKGIYMAFEGVDVLKNVAFDVSPREVRALVGENGAGKSTLVKIIAGIYQPRQGQLEMAGKPVVVAGPHQATAMGIALIHQEPLAFPDLTVAENIFVGSEPTRGLGQAAGLADHVQPCGRIAGFSGPASQPTHEDARAVDGRPTNGGYGRSTFTERAGPAHGRADGSAHAQRSQPPVQHHTSTARPRGGHRLHQPPSGGDFRDRRPDHGHARRRSGRRTPQDNQSRRADPADGRPATPGALRKTGEAATSVQRGWKCGT